MAARMTLYRITAVIVIVLAVAMVAAAQKVRRK
jgi:hypothetical protein